MISWTSRVSNGSLSLASLLLNLLIILLLLLFNETRFPLFFFTKIWHYNSKGLPILLFWSLKKQPASPLISTSSKSLWNKSHKIRYRKRNYSNNFYRIFFFFSSLPDYKILNFWIVVRRLSQSSKSPYLQTAGQAERRRLEEQSAHRRRLSDGKINRRAP